MAVNDSKPPSKPGIEWKRGSEKRVSIGALRKSRLRMQTADSSPHPPPLTLRLVVALCIGLLATALSYFLLHRDGRLAGDFQWPLRGAQALVSGQNPYEVIQPSGPYPFDAPLYYPLPAILVALPFAWLPRAGFFRGFTMSPRRMPPVILRRCSSCPVPCCYSL
jgi:hypothetical protein